MVAAALLATLGGRAVTASAEVKHIRTNDDRAPHGRAGGAHGDGPPGPGVAEPGAVPGGAAGVSLTEKSLDLLLR